MRIGSHTIQLSMRGFTLIELVTTLVLIGVLSTIAVPRMFDNLAYSQRGYAEELAEMLRYSQKIAAASECQVFVTIGPANYSAFQRAALNTCNSAGAWTTPVRHSDGTEVSGSAPPNV